MVNLTTDVVRMIQIILTLAVMGTLFAGLLFIDYRKKQEQKMEYLAFTISLFVLVAALLGIGIYEIFTVYLCELELVLFGITLAIMVITIGGILLPETVRKGFGRKIFVTILGVLYLALIAVGIMIWAEGKLKGSLDYGSLHLGSTLGMPALIMVTLGTWIVVIDESKYSLFHGFSAGGAWVITLLNTISLFMLSQELMKGYSGWLHALHIVCGGIGLTFGFASALFGISGQRRLAKLTGYTTLGCWWLAYLLGFFITLANL